MRNANSKQVNWAEVRIPTIAHTLKANEDELLTLWLADQIYAVVKDEKLANEAIQVTEEKIKFKKRKRN